MSGFEAFLSFLWRYRKLSSPLYTTAGDLITIIRTGWLNQDAGPDFFNALLKIGETTWAGNVEIHVVSSDWYQHKHQNDKSYDNVILHVVYRCDAEIQRTDSTTIPTLEVKNKFDNIYLKNYKKMINSINWIPCERQLSLVPIEKIHVWMERLMIERLERKALQLNDNLKYFSGNLEELLYHQVAEGFGLLINTDPFGLLAKQTPLRVVYRNTHDPEFLEALLFGQAGMLERQFSESYPERLRRCYHYLQQSFSLHSVPEFSWKFLRLRPGSFPTIRIAQFAQLFLKSDKIFQQLLETTQPEKWYELLKVKASPFWEDHYQFDHLSTRKEKCLGHDTASMIILNKIIPFMFFYEKHYALRERTDDFLEIFRQIESEMNLVIKNWQRIGLPVENGFESQSVLELKKYYCDHKRCLECAIGHDLLGMNKPELNPMNEQHIAT